MSWHFSQAGAEASWADSCLAGAPSALLKLMPTPEACSSPASETESSSPSRSGMTSEPSTESHGVGTLTLSAVDSPVRTSAQPALGGDCPASVPASGTKWSGSLAKWDRATSSWRTPQRSLLEDLDLCSEAWPTWGLMRDGECSQLVPSVRHTHAPECSSWPTPTASMAKRGWGIGTGKFRTTGHARYGARPVGNVKEDISMYGWKLRPEALEWLMGFPIGWTAVESLDLPKFQQWSHSHGGH